MNIGGIIKSIGRVVGYIPKTALAYATKKIVEFAITRLLSGSKSDNRKKKEHFMTETEAKAALEQAIRNLVMAGYNAKLVVDAYPGWTQAELEAVIGQTLDDLIGEEETAIVGSNGVINIGIVPDNILEGGSDLVINYIAPQLAKWLKPE
jgi:hypothetical protein